MSANEETPPDGPPPTETAPKACPIIEPLEDRPLPAKPRLVVLGFGFGGYGLLSRVSTKRFDTVLITPRNYFLFTPLLASAVTGTVEFRSILEPAARRLRNVRIIEGLAESLDTDRRRIRCVSAITQEPFSFSYDLLVIAVGVGVADYGIPGVRQHTLTLTGVPDARRIRRAVLGQFAAVEIPGLPEEEIQRRLTFVVCGGGPTGVEVAAGIHDLIRRELTRAFPALACRAKVILLEAGSRLLGNFDDALASYAKAHFAREGIEVRLGSPVTAVEPGLVKLRNGREIRSGCVIWAAGTEPLAFVRSLEAETDRNGRVKVDEYLRVQGMNDVYAIGDCASCGEPPLPATAQVAQQQGAYLSRALEDRRAERKPEPFDFRYHGMLAYIGGGKALADLPHVKWKGRAAWVLWRSAYLTRLVGIKNKLRVLFDWFIARVFGRDLSRF